MSLNKSKGNMYEFVTHTWNTIKGECPHGCSYCYMHRWKNQKPVRFDEKELRNDLGKGNFIFVGSSCDMFSRDIPYQWIVETLYTCCNYDNEYLFQSKDVYGLIEFSGYMPKNSSICTTIETNRWYPEIMKNSPHPDRRSRWMQELRDFKRYVTVEPIMDFDLKELISLLMVFSPEQVNIGADTGRNNLPEPPKEKIVKLISVLDKFTKVHLKSNLKRLMK